MRHAIRAYNFMNTELTSRLYSDFPDLYRGHTKSENLSAMCWGFQCDDGWYGLIRDLSQQLTDYATAHPAANFEAIQVKEKLGWLRFHLAEDDAAALEMIEQTCIRSRTTCERSGQPGVLCVEVLTGTKRRRLRYRVLSEAQAALLGFVPTPDTHTNDQAP